MPMRPFAVLAVPTLLLGGCVAGPPPPSAPSGAPSSPDADEPPFLAVDHADLEVSYLLPGAAVEDDGTMLLWTVAFGEEDGGVPRLLRIASSDDGRTWSDAETVEIDASALALIGPGPIPSSVLEEPDGTWTMYGGGRQTGDEPVIWRATAPDPDGPWTVHPEPVLLPTTAGWDNDGVDHPAVVATANGYLMAYGGASTAAPNRNRIGFARSADGIAWERVTATLPDADDREALGPSACGIEARTMFEPELVVTDAGYRLHFGAMRTEPDVMAIGIAESDDGVTWRCVSDGPIIAGTDLVDGADMHSYLVVRGGRPDRLIIEVLGVESPSSDLWIATP